MTRLQRAGMVGLVLVLGAAMILPGALKGAGSGNKPGAGARNINDLMKEIMGLDEKITGVLPSPVLLADAEYRAGEGQKALPLLKDLAERMAEMEKVIRGDPSLKGMQEVADDVHAARFQALAFAAALGDKEVTAGLEAQAKERSADGVAAECAVAMSRWVLASKDGVAQQKILDGMAAVAKDNSQNNQVLATLAEMVNLGAVNNDMEKKVIEVIRGNMKGAVATALLEQFDGEQAKKALVGQALAVEGRTSTGGTFSSTAYKGKVVMLDFWATWCVGCVEELPNVKKVYAAYHDKGFEIVGVNCDTGDAELNAFIKEKEMPWVQLRETGQNEDKPWHPLTKRYHVEVIPQSFLIDREGVLRYVDAQMDLEKKVGLLVAETAKTVDAGAAGATPAEK
jgi:thiol-disulfide isomerase/thioredoxin